MRAGIALAALALSGCALTRGPDRPVLLHLEPAPPAPPVGAARAGTIALVPIVADGVAAQSRYAYVMPDGSMRQAATLFWERLPSRTVETALLAALSQRFAVVRAAGDGGATERRLSVTLTRFHELAGPGARAVIGLDARATRAGAADWTARVCAASPIASAAAGERAAAFDRALADAVTRLAVGLAENKDVAGPGC